MIITSFDVILVISEFNPSLKLGMLSEIFFVLIFLSNKFLHILEILICEIRSNEIIIKPSDKGYAVVVM